MTEMPEAVGAVVAALIAGLVSLLGLIVSKEQKVSDFRQAWIDALRNNVASLIAHANVIQSYRGDIKSTLTESWRDIRSDFVGINETAGRIQLRLNPGEPESQRILDTIASIELVVSPGGNFEELNRLEQRLVDETNTVLRNEWRRVKAGESIYRISKYLSLLIVLLAAIALLITGYIYIGAQLNYQTGQLSEFKNTANPAVRSVEKSAAKATPPRAR
jgi:predicted PurR-regulated permease PerM